MARSIRYFASTLGSTIYFRASPTRIYAGVIGLQHGGVQFTTGRFFDAPTVEITKAAFAVLNAIKVARLKATDGAGFYTAPRDSWVVADADGLAAIGDVVQPTVRVNGLLQTTRSLI